MLLKQDLFAQQAVETEEAIRLCFLVHFNWRTSKYGTD